MTQEKRITNEINKFILKDTTIYATGSWGIKTRVPESDYDCLTIVKNKESECFNQIEAFNNSSFLKDCKFDETTLSPLTPTGYFTFIELQDKITKTKAISNKLAIVVIIMKSRLINGDDSLLLKLKQKIFLLNKSKHEIIVYSLFRLFEQYILNFKSPKSRAAKKLICDYYYLELLFLKKPELILEGWEVQRNIFLKISKEVEDSKSFSSDPKFSEAFRFLISKI